MPWRYGLICQNTNCPLPGKEYEAFEQSSRPRKFCSRKCKNQVANKLAMLVKRIPDFNAEFWSRTERNEKTGCLEWMGPYSGRWH